MVVQKWWLQACPWVTQSQVQGLWAHIAQMVTDEYKSDVRITLENKVQLGQSAVDSLNTNNTTATVYHYAVGLGEDAHEWKGGMVRAELHS